MRVNVRDIGDTVFRLGQDLGEGVLNDEGIRRWLCALLKKVKRSRYRPGVTRRVGRVIVLFFHDRGTSRRGWVVSSTLRPHLLCALLFSLKQKTKKNKRTRNWRTKMAWWWFANCVKKVHSFVGKKTDRITSDSNSAVCAVISHWCECSS